VGKEETNTTTTSATGSTPAANPNRGPRGTPAVAAATILGQTITNLGAGLTNGIALMANAVTNTAKDDLPQIEAMGYYKGKGALVANMESRDNRRKIHQFFDNKENAQSFLRCEDKYKQEFVQDNILADN